MRFCNIGRMRRSPTRSRCPLTTDPCTLEPIHVPGSIQSFGALLACDQDLVVRQASVNLADFSSFTADEACGQSLLQLFGTPLDALARTLTVAQSIDLPSVRATLHRHHDRLLVELEPHQPAAPDSGLSSDTLLHGSSVEDMLQTVVTKIRELTGFDRVVAYRFQNDDSGHVVAESRVDSLDSYLDLHFPASDIPAQARRLYLLNPLRIIADAASPAVGMHGEDRLLDMTHAALRAVSPVHLEYMANMGVRSSISISIIVRGALWGLVTCGHGAAGVPSHRVRAACSFVGRLCSLSLAALEEVAGASLRAQRLLQTQALVADMPARRDVVRALSPDRLMQLCEGSGVAMLSDGEWTFFGEVPPPAGLALVREWLDKTDVTEIVCTDRLSEALPAASEIAAMASGLLAIAIPTQPVERIVWFRPELIQTVKWGGEPKPKTETSSGRLQPRRSFELWKETVRARSLPWQPSILEAAADLRRHCIELDLVRQVQLVREAIQARDDMVAVVSHDLQSPLAVVQMAASGIWRLTAEDTEPMLRARSSVERIQRAVEVMSSLIRDLLDVSKIEAGRFAVRPRKEQAGALVEDAVDMIRPLAVLRRVEIHVDRTYDAAVHADPERIFQVLSNLIGNAVKFTSQRGNIWVGVAPSESDVVFTVRDDGVGIATDELPRLFDRYWQAANRKQGTGLGLFIAKGIVEAHRGRIWAESCLGSGTTISFSLPISP